jgi:8-oxo-dGTP pyrophosphatase MutT (NUDIX family)
VLRIGDETVTKRAAVAFIERDNKILCVWNRRFQGWGLPGGKAEEGEGLIATVQRELKEETGLHASRLIQFYKAESTLSDGSRMVYVFRVIASGEPREMEENCPVQWMTREELISASPFRDFYIKMFTVITTLKNLTERYAFQKYRRIQVAEIRPYIPGELPIQDISISEADRQQGSPKLGDRIARNPKNHADQWLIAADYFNDNFAPLNPEEAQGTRDFDFERGAAVAFGLMGMAEAIMDADEDRKSRPRCPECNGDRLYKGGIEEHKAGCPRFPL